MPLLSIPLFYYSFILISRCSSPFIALSLHSSVPSFSLFFLIYLRRAVKISRNTSIDDLPQGGLIVFLEIVFVLQAYTMTSPAEVDTYYDIPSQQSVSLYISQLSSTVCLAYGLPGIAALAGAVRSLAQGRGLLDWLDLVTGKGDTFKSYQGFLGIEKGVEIQNWLLTTLTA